jgi:RNA polymerase sigma-70 factor (ECF subfamily)
MNGPKMPDDGMPPDDELVSRARGGDTRAFDDLVRRYQRRIYALVYHMPSNREDADDLVQETFSKAYRSLRRFHGRSSFYTWIYSIASNLALNLLRKRKRRPTMSLDALDEEGFGNDPAFVDSGILGDTPRRVRMNEIQKKLNDCLQKLSDDHRAVVTMHDIEGMPHADIAKILGVSEGTVRSRLFYARRLLQSMMAEFLQ